MKKFITNLFKIFVLILIVIGTTFIFKGYNLYTDVINQQSIESRVEALKNNPDYLEIMEINETSIKLLLKSEDKRFYSHSGFDYLAITRSLYNDIKYRSFVQGGSTITQQLAKNLCFDFNKTIERKIAELLVARDLENLYEKDEIIEYYLNISYFGEGCYGLKNASIYYYGSQPINLTLKQSASLIFCLRGPSIFNPAVYNINQNQHFINNVVNKVMISQ